MYHRKLNVYIAAQDSQLETLIKNVPPVDNFSHQFVSCPKIRTADLKQYGIIILDFDTVPPESLEEIISATNNRTVVIGAFTRDNLPILANHYHLFDQVWVQPYSKHEVCTSFGNTLQRLKTQEDFILTQQYLDTLIDSIPDLVWFKDARGSHLKVNNSFCRAVNKTRARIEGRGHYYIWDLEPDEYAKGEY
ncbi:MAG: GGDEF domain-containing protein, partial [Desulfobacterales bacterium]|nr:GGDEF domain-containing protein [Desulfobacterales bacterium]